MDIFLESVIDTCLWYAWCKLPGMCLLLKPLYADTTEQQTSELIGPKSEHWLNTIHTHKCSSNLLVTDSDI